MKNEGEDEEEDLTNMFGAFKEELNKMDEEKSI